MVFWGVNHIMNSLRSEHLSKRLYWAMSIVILSLVLICIPLIVASAQTYFQSVKMHKQLQILSHVADLANKISRERGPANNLMSSSVMEVEKHQQELDAYRQLVDAKIQDVILVLNQNELEGLSQQVIHSLQPTLLQARAQVDQYVSLPRSKRNAAQLDQAILKMFSAWERTRDVMSEFLITTKIPSTHLSTFASQILLLSDLRDQAGRVASNVMAHVAFNTHLPDDNVTRALQTKYQVKYLWGLIDTLQPSQYKTTQFIELHSQIEKQFIRNGIPLVSDLITDSLNHQHYRLTATQLTDAISDKFLTVIHLQTYLIDYSIELAYQEKMDNLKKLLWTIAISLISIVTAIATMVFSRRRIFLPLIAAREILFDLSKSKDNESPNFNEAIRPENDTLFAAIKKLEQMLQQRDALEFRLKNIAHSDSLTGLSNRFALEEYTKFLQAHPSKFLHTCLMIIDIDHFKAVNDRYGHIIGDMVIQSVADCLKMNVRTSDMIVRYGGDEFLILIENIEMMNALNIANKIRKEVKAETILDLEGKIIPFSVSIGVAIGAESWLALLELADQALFKAKAKGRNVVAEA